MQQKPAQTQVDIHELIKSRWSPKAFDPDREVDHNDLLAMLEAARWAPSSYNDQPWRFIVCKKFDNHSAWNKVLSTLSDNNSRWAQNAPVLIVTIAMNLLSRNGLPNRCAMYDTGAACLSLSLQATALGLVVHQMGGFDQKRASEVFELPDDCKPMTVIAVGYQADLNVLDEDFRQSELSVRARAPLSERFFMDSWGKGFE